MYFKATNTGHSYAPNDMHYFSLGTAVRLEKNLMRARKKELGD